MLPESRFRDELRPSTVFHSITLSGHVFGCLKIVKLDNYRPLLSTTFIDHNYRPQLSTTSIDHIYASRDLIIHKAPFNSSRTFIINDNLKYQILTILIGNQAR